MTDTAPGPSPAAQTPKPRTRRRRSSSVDTSPRARIVDTRFYIELRGGLMVATGYVTFGRDGSRKLVRIHTLAGVVVSEAPLRGRATSGKALKAFEDYTRSINAGGGGA